MKILYVLPRLPHPTMRSELRHYHLLTRLAARHDITLLVLTKLPPTAEAIAEFQERTSSLLLVDASPERPGARRRGRSGARAGVLARRVAGRLRVWEARREVRRLIEWQVRSERFDVLLMYDADLAALLGAGAALPTVLDLADATSLRLRQRLRYVPMTALPWRALRYWQTRRVERRLLRRYSHVSFICPRDRDALGVPKGGASIIPNGVDAEYWKRRTAPSGRPVIVFTGVLDYPPNADAALHLLRRIAPTIRRSVPGLEVVIAGRHPSAALEREAAGQPGVRITGGLDDLRPELERAALFAAPIRFASGTQNKLLEAMAMSLPVVTTSVAAGGLHVDGASPPVLVADEPEAFASLVARMLRNPDACRQAGVEGRRFVTRTFDWDRSAVALERLCLEAARHRRLADAHARALRAPIERRPAAHPDAS